MATLTVVPVSVERDPGKAGIYLHYIERRASLQSVTHSVDCSCNAVSWF